MYGARLGLITSEGGCGMSIADIDMKEIRTSELEGYIIQAHKLEKNEKVKNENEQTGG